jgi:hypothetical protein
MDFKDLTFFIAVYEAKSFRGASDALDTVTLDELVAKKYLRSMPVDPITRSAASWIVVAPADPALGAVYDVKSGAKGAGRDGKPYEQW